MLTTCSCPLTEHNAKHLMEQRNCFVDGSPGPDFPGGKGESQHIGRGTPELLSESSKLDARRAMGLEAFDDDGSELVKIVNSLM